MSNKESSGWSNGYYYGSLGNGDAASSQPYDQPSSQANPNTGAQSYGSNGSQSQSYALQSYSQSQQDPWSTYTTQHAYNPNNYPQNYQTSGSHNASRGNPNNSPYNDSHTNRKNDASDNSYSNQGYNADNRPHKNYKKHPRR